MTDPISDMLTRIRNASKALLPEVSIPYSKLKVSIGEILCREGYVQACSVESKMPRAIKLKLKYQGRKGVIEGLRRASRPGLRVYTGSGKIPRVLGGMGTTIVSTSRGVMTGNEARKQNLGGEVLCYVW